MTRLLISLSDFPDYVPFSVNIDALLVTPHIRSAQTFDVEPLLGESQWDDLEQALLAVTPEYQPLEFDSAEFLVEAVQAGWPDPRLARLWFAGVRPLLVCESARRMLLWHGAHVTPNGLETISDVGHMPVSNAQRTELRADLEKQCQYYRTRLATAQRAAYPTTSCSSCKPAVGPA